MDLRKRGVEEGDSVLLDSGLFGTIDRDEAADLTRNSETGFSASSSCEARKKARASVLEAEYWKAQYIMLLRQNSFK